MGARLLGRESLLKWKRQWTIIGRMECKGRLAKETKGLYSHSRKKLVAEFNSQKDSALRSMTANIPGHVLKTHPILSTLSWGKVPSNTTGLTSDEMRMGICPKGFKRTQDLPIQARFSPAMCEWEEQLRANPPTSGLIWTSRSEDVISKSDGSHCTFLLKN